LVHDPDEWLNLEPLFTNVIQRCPEITVWGFAAGTDVPVPVHNTSFRLSSHRIHTNIVSVSQNDTTLRVYETHGTPSALLIPGLPVVKRSIINADQIFPKIAAAHWLASQDREICLVTDVYVSRKVAVDHRQNRIPAYYIVNLRQGQIPSDFNLCTNSPSLNVLPNDPRFAGEWVVFLERHRTRHRSDPFTLRKGFWDKVIRYLLFISTLIK